MSPEPTPDDFDWVAAQAKCSTQLMFEHLRTRVRGDVQHRNGVFNRGDHWRFEFHDEGDEMRARYRAAFAQWEGLDELKDAGAALLTEAAEDEQAPRRRVAVLMLGRLSDEQSLRLLERLLHDEEWAFRFAAAEALRRRGWGPRTSGGGRRR